jgi:hypothetical protein
MGRPVVRTIRVLPVGNLTAPIPAACDTRQDAAEAPVRTRDDGCPGYQDTRALVLEHRPPAPDINPYITEAMARQEAALRAGRQPETEHRDAVWTQQPASPARDRGEESLARARAYARQHAAGRTPRRAFDSA